MFLKVGQLLLSNPVVVAHRRDDFQSGVQCAQGDLETYLVIAGGRTAMRHRGRAAFGRQLGESFCLQSAFGADAQRIGLAAKYVAGNQVLNDGIEEILFGINQHMFDGTQRE